MWWLFIYTHVHVYMYVYIYMNVRTCTYVDERQKKTDFYVQNDDNDDNNDNEDDYNDVNSPMMFQKWSPECSFVYPPCSLGRNDDVYLKKIITRGVTKSNPTQKCRPAKGIRESTYKWWKIRIIPG
jgi:hypothetical protein